MAKGGRSSLPRGCRSSSSSFGFFSSCHHFPGGDPTSYKSRKQTASSEVCLRNLVSRYASYSSAHILASTGLKSLHTCKRYCFDIVVRGFEALWDFWDLSLTQVLSPSIGTSSPVHTLAWGSCHLAVRLPSL